MATSFRNNCRKIICIGRNYAYVFSDSIQSFCGQTKVQLTDTIFKNRDHITELNNTRPKQPFFFLKPSSSILLPGHGPVLRPKGVNMHYEVELGLVIGKTVRDLDPEDHKTALDSIASMSIFLS
jgi:2-keto-4-pentenoate hydratase/2-oxohepta-3-ene-1,7-dioic acid hydratase in catechol pathway